MSLPVPVLPRPAWIKARAPMGGGYDRLRGLMRDLDLHTVCEEARCPNVGECWNRGTATFMILGDVCTRACKYCGVAHGMPTGLDLDEPRRVADTVAAMALEHVVITSVNRDELPDGGAGIYAETIRQIRARLPRCSVEVLIPDFKGDESALSTVLAAEPAILGHNLETVERLCDHIGVIQKGRLVAEGPIDVLRAGGAAGRSLEQIFLTLIGADEGETPSLGWLAE